MEEKTIYLINGSFEFAQSKQQLTELKSGDKTKLEPLMSQVMSHLITNRSGVISRQELISKYRSTDIYADEALTKVISKIRKSLRDECAEPKYIKTLSKLGYEWIGDVRVKKSAFQNVSNQIQTFQFNKRTMVSLSLTLLILLVVKSIFFPHH